MKRVMSLSVAAVLVCALQAQGQVGIFRTVVLSGEQAQGTGTGVSYLAFSPISLRFNDENQTVFLANLSGVGVTEDNDNAIVSEGWGTGPAVTAREGDQAPDLPVGVRYSLLSQPAFSALGETAVTASLSGPGITAENGFAIFSEAVGPGGFSPIARAGQQATGLPAGVNYALLFPPQLNKAGRAAFSSHLAGAGVTASNDRAIFEGSGSGLNLVARSGNQAGGLAAGVHYGGLGSPLIDDVGRLAFYSGLDGEDVTLDDDEAFFSEGGGAGAVAIARAGAPAAGLPSHTRYATLTPSSLQFNGLGKAAFHAMLSGPQVNSGNDGALFSEGGGALTILAREGDPSPGLAADVLYGAFEPDSLRLNRAGQAAFVASLTGDGATSGDNEAVFTAGGGSGLTALVRTGQQATGLAPGILYHGFEASIQLDDHGHTAFFAHLRGDDT
ncbi:MAG: hypothetical protein KDA21_07965, partial [Phycisphaerales bacterium]|nr:hypothetical protein [Phycisphaerales bacterium]